mmetsp:Transcript_19891/g.41179  ORF Transcript_19891/g.41179 Transcript_19891/m.41179 type:complete len:132 (-) Transcript_19891:243-638(-)|eukprot:CAMPEP_0201143046 /NCGR_PEP_ID=MMETSP0851-20130426/4780_1 /ASSEMBLY_ACC=CAM_ASM_000631 /TAXON_ID=183588 /ORGANISM="Pseudo-nitzschia fraudulenta, Strain WWA7" /LENGTH=131 /DNA_ID=CAMNT_0047417079 /DNA_START=64 /DNA_END=459 /DNA_ORIENTATION=+
MTKTETMSIIKRMTKQTKRRKSATVTPTTISSSSAKISISNNKMQQQDRSMPVRTSYPVMINDDDSLEYQQDSFSRLLKQQKDNDVFLRRPSMTEITIKNDTNNAMVLRVRRLVSQRSSFRRSFVDLAVLG